MTLRSRLAASILLSFVLALLLGILIVVWHAQNSVQTEMSTALAGDVDMVKAALPTAASNSSRSFLDRLVKSLDGQRHVRAQLWIDEHNVANSDLARSPDEPPAWFVRVVSPVSNHYTFSGANRWRILLETDAHNEIGEVWTQSRDALFVMAILCGLLSISIYLLILRSLGFLRTLGSALELVGGGDYTVSVHPTGPDDFIALSNSFNHMVGHLRYYRDQASLLRRQIVTLQEEERAQLAADLHDEIGPLLFSINVDAEAIPRAKANSNEIGAQVRRIRDASDRIRNQIRAILRQLRPIDHLDFGLESALSDLERFWTLRSPGLVLEITNDLMPADLARDRMETIYRVVQESVSNSVRHGRAKHIEVCLSSCDDKIQLTIEDDGAGQSLRDGRSGIGLSLMKDRIAACGGTLEVSRDPTGGFSVVACLPVREVEAADP